MDTQVIIAGGGHSSRFQNKLPKPFVLLNNHPMILYSITTFKSLGISIRLIIPSEHEDHWLQIAQKYHLTDIPYTFGQPTRYLSIRHALNNCPRSKTILIHDAARPFFSATLVGDILRMLDQYQACVPLAPAVDTIKEYKNDTVVATLNREVLGYTQTPMGFDFMALQELIAQQSNNELTDESQLFELAERPIGIVKGTRSNIKLTYPEDLGFAQYYAREYHTLKL